MSEPNGRERIIAATLELIGSEGIRGVTNRQIARHAGVSLGSITYHFANQRELLTESLLHFVRAETKRLALLASAWETEVPSVEQAARIVDIVARETLEGGPDSTELAPYELFIHAGRDAGIRPAAAEGFAAYDALAHTVLSALGIAEAETLAPTVVALVLGTQLRRIATGESASDIAEALNRLL